MLRTGPLPRSGVLVRDGGGVSSAAGAVGTSPSCGASPESAIDSPSARATLSSPPRRQTAAPSAASGRADEAVGLHVDRVERGANRPGSSSPTSTIDDLVARHHVAQRLDQRLRVADLEGRGQHDDARLARLEQIDRVVAARLDERPRPRPAEAARRARLPARRPVPDRRRPGRTAMAIRDDASASTSIARLPATDPSGGPSARQYTSSA